jgi:hypothetical protein
MRNRKKKRIAFQNDAIGAFMGRSSQPISMGEAHDLRYNQPPRHNPADRFRQLLGLPLSETSHHYYEPRVPPAQAFARLVSGNPIQGKKKKRRSRKK